LQAPQYVAVDLTGNVYISDYGNNVVRKVNTAGIISTFAGDTTGYGTVYSCAYSGDGGQATAARLCGPQGIALDNTGNVYIADNGTNFIRKVNTAGIISTVAGDTTGVSTGSNHGYTGDGGIATNAQLSSPYDVAIDAVGNIYIADNQNNVIRIVNTAGIISTIAGDGYGASGFPGFPMPGGGFSGDGGYATAAELWQPNGVVVDAAGSIYISDMQNNVIRKVSVGTPMAGIKQYVGKNNSFSVYPNPANGNVTVGLSDAADYIRITDMQGRTMYETQNTAASELKLDISNYTKGMYFVVAKIGNTIEKQKLIVE
jgi:sugar lactone lactonase YvrE